jgi:hypothetical protein
LEKLAVWSQSLETVRVEHAAVITARIRRPLSAFIRLSSERENDIAPA